MKLIFYIWDKIDDFFGTEFGKWVLAFAWIGWIIIGWYAITKVGLYFASHIRILWI